MDDREIRILLLEDNPSDAELVKRELRKAGLGFTAEWAQDQAAFLHALESFAPDIVLADYLLPGFSGLAALELAKQRSAETPVILVSGAVGEEVAIETLKAGATDYVLKDRLSRLGPVVRRALQEAEQLAQRKRAEAALRDRDRELQLILDAGPTLIAYVDAEARYRWANKTYERWLGRTVADVPGRYVREVLGAPAWQKIEPYVQRALAGETVTYEQELSLPQGESRWVYASYTPDRDESGRVQGFVVHAVDITERKRAEAALRELTRTLESKVVQRTAELECRARQLQKLTLDLSQTEDRERKRLADILHDDLQQQLAAAKFHLGLLGSRARFDGATQKAAGQIADMLMQAIQTSRNLSHELSPPLLYHGDVGETLKWLAGQIRTKHGLDVQVRTGGPVDAESEALKAFLYKAAQEMLFNIVKHARIGTAKLRLRRVGGYLCLIVSDRGRGFDPRDLKATTGFGLFSLRERVHLLGGRMKIRSAEGRGSTFFIAVPDGVAPEGAVRVGPRAYSACETPDSPAPKEGSHAGEEGNHAGAPLRVLVADDHEVVRQGLTALLREQRDIEVVGEAANGREAVDLAYQLQPDVVIMDVAMPLMNGDEAARQILKHRPRTRIIALSMHEEASAVARMRQAGARTYLLKTSPTDELLAALRGPSSHPN